MVCPHACHAHSFGKSRRASCKSLSEQHLHCHVAAMCIRKHWEWQPVGRNHLLWQVSRKHQGQGGNHTAVDPAIDRRKLKQKHWLQIASLYTALHTEGCLFQCGNKSCTDTWKVLKLAMQPNRTTTQVLRMNDGILPVAPPVLSRAFQALHQNPFIALKWSILTFGGLECPQNWLPLHIARNCPVELSTCRMRERLLTFLFLTHMRRLGQIDCPDGTRM